MIIGDPTTCGLPFVGAQRKSRCSLSGRDYYPELGRWVVVDPARQFVVAKPCHRQAGGNPLGASGYVFNGNTAVNGYDEDGQWFLVDDLIAAGVSFVVGYVSHGLSTGEWGKEAVVSGSVSAVAGWVGWNTGGASLAAGQNLSFGTTIGYGATSGAFSGMTYGGLKYTTDASYRNGEFSLNNLRKNWNTGSFLDATGKGGVNGAFSGAVISGTLWGIENVADKLGYLDDPIKVKEGMGVQVDRLQFPDGSPFTGAENALSLEKIGIPIKRAPIYWDKHSFFKSTIQRYKYSFTIKDVLYKSTGLAKHVVNQFRYMSVHSGMMISNNNKLSDSITRYYNSWIDKLKDDKKQKYWWKIYRFKF